MQLLPTEQVVSINLLMTKSELIDLISEMHFGLSYDNHPTAWRLAYLLSKEYDGGWNMAPPEEVE